MKIRLLSVPVLLALVASLAACGGGSQSVPANAIAVVNGTPVTLATFNEYFQQHVAAAKATTGTAPSPGTPQYTTLRQQTVAQVVEIAEVKQQMAKEGVTVTHADVTKFLANLVKTNYNGSEKAFQAALKKAGLTQKAAEDQVFVNLMATKLHDAVTKSATVSESDEKAYYQSNIAQYAVAAAVTRNIAHILVKTKAEALSIEKKLAKGASFAALAKKYSTDTGSAANGGQLCMAKSGQSGSCSQMVAPFAKAAWALKTGQISQPVHSQFGWHVIKAVGPVKHVKASTQTFNQVKATIQQTLLQQKQATLWQQWLTDLQNEYKGKVSYQSGYQPPATTAVSTTPTG